MTQERENFYRHSNLVTDNTKDGFADLLEFYLQQQGVTLKDFISQHQHAIYHFCYNRFACCQCSPNNNPNTKGSKVLYPPQLDLLLDTSAGKLPGHNPNNPSAPHCCCPVNPGVTLEKLDVHLLRFLLVNFTNIIPPGSPERKAVEDLTKIRNQSLAHASKGCMTDGQFNKSVAVIKQSLLVLAQVSGKQTSTLEKFNKVCQQPISWPLFNQLQESLLQEARLLELVERFDTKPKRVCMKKIPMQ